MRTEVLRRGYMEFPVLRMRRLREKENIREMISETVIEISKLIYPLFVNEKLNVKKEIATMPGQYVYPLSDITEVVSELADAGIKFVILFGIPSVKDTKGTGAYNKDGVVQKALAEIKRSSSITAITDLCLCEYTDNGQCGIVRNGRVSNDETLELYAKIAVSQAEAGADVIAPSGMMDGQVKRIRRALDESGFQDVPVLAYAGKMASSLYGPFRDAAESTPKEGDRKGYQLNYANAREALREILLDEKEGADLLMVKPALTNLDLIWRARERTLVPVGAFNVSGEYAMIRWAASAGAIDYRQAVRETITSIFRAGADFVITYHALELANWNGEGK
ncbi:MAG: porphobilinogen synthase [Methanomassiliicoccales archaeon]